MADCLTCSHRDLLSTLHPLIQFVSFVFRRIARSVFPFAEVRYGRPDIADLLTLLISLTAEFTDFADCGFWVWFASLAFLVTFQWWVWLLHRPFLHQCNACMFHRPLCYSVRCWHLSSALTFTFSHFTSMLIWFCVKFKVVKFNYRLVDKWYCAGFAFISPFVLRIGFSHCSPTLIWYNVITSGTFWLWNLPLDTWADDTMLILLLFLRSFFVLAFHIALRHWFDLLLQVQVRLGYKIYIWVRGQMILCWFRFYFSILLLYLLFTLRSSTLIWFSGISLGTFWLWSLPLDTCTSNSMFFFTFYFSILSLYLPFNAFTCVKKGNSSFQFTPLLLARSGKAQVTLRTSSLLLRTGDAAQVGKRCVSLHVIQVLIYFTPGSNAD